MKRFLAAALVVSMILPASTVMAADMGVQIIGGDETAEEETVSLDDIKIEQEIEVPNQCKFTPTSFEVVDSFMTYDEGKHKSNYSSTYSSGEEADYAMLRIDIVNLKTVSMDFLKDIEITVISDDKYEFAGWAYQYNYDNEDSYPKDDEDRNKNYVINENDQFSIEPMYAGHYVFGCTLPNSVVEAKTPLRMEIKFAGNEITYNIRK